MNKKNLFKKILILLFCINMNSYSMDKAFANLEKGKNYLNNHYDYANAIKFFLSANEFYDQNSNTDEMNQLKTQVWSGLEMSYHNIGSVIERDKYMEKMRNILGIPDSISQYNDKSKFSESAIGYFVINGYKFYIYFEQYKKASSPIDQQESSLLLAKESFLKAIEISDILKLSTEFSTHAQHALGTVFEFLSACQIERNNIKQAEKYAKQSIDAFTKALNMRKSLLGENNVNVARSCHKLARSYLSYCRLLPKSSSTYNNYIELANSYYKKAIDVFEKNKIDINQSKYKELIEEYNKFMIER